MPPRPLTPLSAPPAALAAFLRGMERRGVVFAELQAGTAAGGDHALAATLQAFAARSGSIPFVEWPRRFWTMLLAVPALRTPARPAQRADALAVLDGLGSGPRAALLLRLVAGLSEGDAAAVLGISRPTYRLALQRALPRQEDGGADLELWQAMRAVVREAVWRVPAERLERLADPARIEGTLSRASRGRVRASVVDRPRWLWPLLGLVVVMTLAALVATWFMPSLSGPARESVSSATIRGEALPESNPAVRATEDTLLLTHRDLELLLDGVEGKPVSADPAFDAWLVVALAGGAADDGIEAAPVSDVEPMPAVTGSEMSEATDGTF